MTKPKAVPEKKTKDPTPHIQTRKPSTKQSHTEFGSRHTAKTTTLQYSGEGGLERSERGVILEAQQ